MDELLSIVQKAIDEKKGERALLYDFHELNPFIDHVVICSAPNWRRLMVWIPGLPILWELHTMYASSFRMRKRRPGCVHICRITWRKQPLYGMAISERIM